MIVTVLTYVCILPSLTCTLHGAETWDMGLGTGIALPQVLGGEDAKSWFKCFKVCVKANRWNDENKLYHVVTLLQGRICTVYDSLTDDEMVTYAQSHPQFPSTRQGLEGKVWG